MRPSRHQMYLAMARAAAMRATCYRLNVGAVVVEDRNVISIGYNGAQTGAPHCVGEGCPYYTPAGCTVTHAEANALERARRGPGERFLVSVYCTHSPCNACVSLMVTQRLDDKAAGAVVEEFYYETAYRDATPINRLLAVDVPVFRVLPSGLMVDEKTGALCGPS